MFERASMMEELEKTKALELDTSYAPKSFSEVEIDEHAWTQVLATIDVSAMSKGTKFCDDFGYDTIPIRMVNVIPDLLVQESETNTGETSLNWVKTELTLSENEDENGIGYEANSDWTDNDVEDPIILESELDKIRILLRQREPQTKELETETIKRKRARRKRQAKSRGVKNPPPEIKGKNEYLHMVGAIDCIKQYNEWKTTLGLIQSCTEPQPNPKKPRQKPVKARSLARKLDEQKQKETDQPSKEKLTKVKRKAHYEHCKRILRKQWDSVSTSESEEEVPNPDLPENLKSYTIQDRTIYTQLPKRAKPDVKGESYDGPEDAKPVDLAQPGEDP